MTQLLNKKDGNFSNIIIKIIISTIVNHRTYCQLFSAYPFYKIVRTCQFILSM